MIDAIPFPLDVITIVGMWTWLGILIIRERKGRR